MNFKRRLCLYLALVLALGVWYFLGRGEDRFCWLVFGPNGDTRLLLRVANEELFLDRDGDGRFNGPGERLGRLELAPKVELTGRDGHTRYVLTNFRLFEEPELGQRCLINAEIYGPLDFAQMADTGLGRFRRTAPMAHFNGPLTVQAQSIFWKLPPGMALVRGDKPADLRVLIGTLDAATECWTSVRVQGTNQQSLFPTNVNPVVDIEYPPKSAGAQPQRVRYALEEFC
jgi:hypothetical protein